MYLFNLFQEMRNQCFVGPMHGYLATKIEADWCIQHEVSLLNRKLLKQSINIAIGYSK